MSLSDFYWHITIFFIMGTIISSIFLYFKVGRKFDKLFKERKPIWDMDIPIQSQMCRASLYAGCCISTFYSQRPNQKWLYGDYNFKANSTVFDKVISVIHFTCGGMLLLLGLVYVIFHFLIPFILKIF